MDKKDKMVMPLFYNSHDGFFGRVLAVAFLGWQKIAAYDANHPQG